MSILRRKLSEDTLEHFEEKLSEDTLVHFEKKTG